MDRLRAIEIFTEVAKGRSFTGAALRMGIAKGNVTKHVAWLEGQLGVQLLTRTTKSVSLTEAGARLLQGGQDLLERFDAVGDSVRGAARATKGTIRVGTPPSFGAVHLVPMMTRFSDQHTGIQFELQLDDGRLDITSEGLDLSLRIAPALKDTSLKALKLGSVPQLLVASRTYLNARGRPRTPDDLLDHDCLMNALKAPTNIWQLSNKRSGKSVTRPVRVSGRIRSNFGEALRHAALLGYGISMHPNYMVDDDIAANRLEVVLPQVQAPGLDIYAVYPERRNMPGRVRLFLDFLMARFSENAAWQQPDSGPRRQIRKR